MTRPKASNEPPNHPFSTKDRTEELDPRPMADFAPRNAQRCAGDSLRRLVFARQAAFRRLHWGFAPPCGCPRNDSLDAVV